MRLQLPILGKRVGHHTVRRNQFLSVLAIVTAVVATPVEAQEFGPARVLSGTVPNSDTAHDRNPQVSTDGGGNWVAVWESSESLSDTVGTDRDILVSRSADDGVTWSAPAALNANAASDSGEDSRPQVSTDRSGNWIAVWFSDDSLGGAIGTDHDVLIARSVDNGATWSVPTALNTNADSDSGHDEYPQMSTDRSGNWIAVWQSADSLFGTIGTDRDILVSRSSDNGSTWSNPAALNTNAGSDSGHDDSPQVSTDHSGNWVAVWYSTDSLASTIGTDRDILVSRSSDNGATWSDPAALNTDADADTGADSAPQVSTDSEGNWVVAWISGTNLGGTIGADTDVFVARSTDNGTTWSNASALNSYAASDSRADYEPQVTSDGNGNWVATWFSVDTLGGTIGTDRDIIVAGSTDNGATWSTASALNSNAASDSTDDYGPQVTTDGVGKWIALWYSHASFGAIGEDADILVSRSTDNGVTWSALAVLNSNAAEDSGGDFSPQVCTDGGDQWIAVWSSTDRLGGTIGADYDILLSHSSDDGATWSASAALNSGAATDSGSDYSPRVSTDRNGNWVAVWYSTDSLGGTIGTDRDIMVSRSTDNGATWSAVVALASNATFDAGDDYDPQVSTDGGGNWVAVWYSDDSLGSTIGADWDLLVSRSTDDGATWSPPSALNSNAAADSGDDYDPEVSTDGTGNWVAVWYSGDSLGGTIGSLDYDILTARSTDNGATWTAVTPLNSNAGGDTRSDRDPQVTTDGGGNWVAVWESWDSLGGTIGSDYDILTARSTDGGATWSAVAALNPNAGFDSGHDFNAQVSHDGHGNWLAVWSSWDSLDDTIDGDADIVLSRSTDNGVTWSAPAPLNTNAGSDMGNDYIPQVGTDGNGHWVSVWLSYDSLAGSASSGVPDIFVAVASALCGDGVISGSEQCDDGSAGSGDGCDASCQIESGHYCDTPGSPCEACTICALDQYESATCSADADAVCANCATCAAGAYEAIPCGGSEDTVCGPCNSACETCAGGASDQCLSCSAGYSIIGGSCADNDECSVMTDDCDANATCTNTAGSFACACNNGYSGDGQTCASDGPCPAAQQDCREAQKSQLLIKDKDDDRRDKLVWKWLLGDSTSQEDFADPTSTASFSFCLYAGTAATVIAASEVPADGNKWKPIGDRGYKYKDKDGTAAGIHKLTLKGGEAGKAKAKVRGRGPDLPEVSLPFDPPVIVQLVNNQTGVCFQSVYDEPQIRKNDGKIFHAKAP